MEKITDPKGNTLLFAYDSKKRLVRVTNQKGLHWSFERDIVGRVVRETDFDGRTLAYEYDPAGHVIRRDNPDISWLEYDYDKSGLMIEMRAFADAKAAPLVTRYEYDGNGALIATANADAEIELTRDAMGRITAETVNGVTVTSEIDCCGRRSARRIDGQNLDFFL